MKLTDIKNQCFSSLDRRDDLMFTHDRIGNSVSCRMSVRVFYDGDSYRYSIHYSTSLKGTLRATN